MNSNKELSQQINGVEADASSVEASSGMNGTGTYAKSDTPLTRPRSGFDLEATRRQLIAIRTKYGARSPIGYRCSNICEMMESLPPGPEHRIEYLTQDGVKYQRNRLLENIQQQSADLAKLLAARPNQ